MENWENLLINLESFSNLPNKSWSSFWVNPLKKISNFIPTRLANLTDWVIKLTPTGYSIQGFHINMHHFSSNMQNYLRWLIGFLLINQCSANSVAQSYYFKTMGNTIYKLWFSGLENLAPTIISQLTNGACNTTTTDQMPSDMVLVENYYDHGGTVPMYAAVLTRDKSGLPDLDVQKCVSALLEMAHEAWNKQVNSGETIGIVVGSIVAVVVCVAVTSGVVVYCKTRNKKPDEGSLLENNSLSAPQK